MLAQEIFEAFHPHHLFAITKKRRCNPEGTILDEEN